MNGNIFNYLKKQKKFILISALAYVLFFAIGMAKSDFFAAYQNKIIADLLENAVGKRFLGVVTSLIWTNIKAAAMGVFLGIFLLPTIALVAINGYLFGAITSRALTHFGINQVLLRVLPHGIFEIPAAIISYALGFSIAASIIKKKNRKKRIIDVYKHSFSVFVKLIVPLLAVSGIIEGIIFLYHSTFTKIVIELQLTYVLYSLALLYLFYIILKLFLAYQKSRNLKLIVILAFVLMFASELWMRAYQVRVEDFFQKFRIVITMIPLLIFLLYLYMEDKRYKAEADKMKIQGAFQQYMSPEVIDEVLKHPEKLKLGGEEKEITILFSDIRSFTAISEGLKPEGLVKLLNEYLSAMTEIILKYKGVVDKYIGDAIMAFWGAPVDDPIHDKNACLVALEMQKKLRELRKTWEQRGLPKIRVGIGVNTGPVVVGNMGSKQRFDYTVMGDHVNLASRLEMITKQYGAEIIISEFTYNKIKKYGFVCRELDLVVVKGRTKPVKIYHLTAEKGKTSPKERKFIPEFEKGLADYRNKKWNKAEKIFKKCLKIFPEDKSCNLYIKRCEQFKKHAPPKNWNGVFEMKTK